MIIYLHGFASVGNSPKVKMLNEAFGKDNVLAPDLPFDPAKVGMLVRGYIHTCIQQANPGEKIILVGTSLGGFYANYFGQLYDCPVVLINPSVRPNEALRKRIGINKNFATGEEFMVSIAHMEALDSMRDLAASTYNGALVNLFVAKDDDVVPYEAALEALPYRAFTMITETGGHRFTEHMPSVIGRIKELMKQRGIGIVAVP